MIGTIMTFVGAGLTVIWGVVHLFPTKPVVEGFGDISEDNRRIITMEWITEGVALVFIGAVVCVATSLGRDTAVASGIYVVSMFALATMAVVSIFTGFRVKYLPFKLCPVIFTVSALLIGLGGFVLD